MAQLAVAKLVGESRRSAHRRQCCRNKHHSQDHHYPSSYAHSTSFLSVPDGLCWRNGGLLEGSVGFCAEPSRCVCEPFVCRCSPISSPLESGSNREIGPPPKGLNSHPPKALMPKGLPLRQRTESTDLVTLGCCKCPRRLILGKWASGIRGSRKLKIIESIRRARVVIPWLSSLSVIHSGLKARTTNFAEAAAAAATAVPRELDPEQCTNYPVL